MGRLVILSGPSCVGKSPLEKAMGRFYPELKKKLKNIVLYNSRSPRPGEIDGIDYHFRPRKHIEKLKSQVRYVVMDVRGDLQALDIQELKANLNKGDVFFEGNPFVGRTLQTHESLSDIDRLSIFMAPLSKEEIKAIKTDPNSEPEKIITDVMRRKLLRRTRKQKGELSLKDLENIERRAGSAYRELQDAHFFEYVLPNHDGEDSENWDAFYYPVGDSRKSLLAFVSILNGEKPNFAEEWNKDLID